MLGCHFQGFEEENSRAFISSEAEEQETNLMGPASNPAVNTFRFQKINCTKIIHCNMQTSKMQNLARQVGQGTWLDSQVSGCC